jgi:hypothetical protein
MVLHGLLLVALRLVYGDEFEEYLLTSRIWRRVIFIDVSGERTASVFSVEDYKPSNDTCEKPTEYTAHILEVSSIYSTP